MHIPQTRTPAVVDTIVVGWQPPAGGKKDPEVGQLQLEWVRLGSREQLRGQVTDAEWH